MMELKKVDFVAAMRDTADDLDRVAESLLNLLAEPLGKYQVASKAETVKNVATYLKNQANLLETTELKG